MHIGVFCFRRDLRLHDNMALHRLCRTCTMVLPVFCLDPRQVKSSENSYYSPRAVQFMFESLLDLDQQIRSNHRQRSPKSNPNGQHQSTTNARLTVATGRPEECLPQIVDALLKTHRSASPKITVAWNEDNTPFSVARDKKLTQVLLSKYDNRQVHVRTDADDVTVVPVRGIQTNTGGRYQMFTPFYRKALATGVATPVPLPKTTFICLPPQASLTRCKLRSVSDLRSSSDFKHVYKAPPCCIRGGRKEALRRIRADYLISRCANYNRERDHTWEEKTTRLSAYFKFGCVSFREAYHKIVDALQATHPVACEALTRELFWNAFYSYVSYCFPHVLQGQRHAYSSGTPTAAAGHRNKEMLTHLQGRIDTVWRTSRPEWLQRWKDGHTGFPYIDAAMRQLKTTGWMHNRARMVVASFLVKDLRIDWREGEKHFAQQLVDYDPSANNGGWQWAASTGADALQYTRIFNPWTQSQKFDPHGKYIRMYVPELSDQRIPAKHLHEWWKPAVRDTYANHPQASTYPAPMIDHAEQRKHTLAAWKALTPSKRSAKNTVGLRGE